MNKSISGIKSAVSTRAAPGSPIEREHFFKPAGEGPSRLWYWLILVEELNRTFMIER
jgi:hypothetical protein